MLYTTIPHFLLQSIRETIYFNDRFPKKDNRSFPLDVKNTPAFCLPMGVQIEWFRNRDTKPTPQFSSFVLTNEKGAKVSDQLLTNNTAFILNAW